MNTGSINVLKKLASLSEECASEGLYDEMNMLDAVIVNISTKLAGKTFKKQGPVCKKCHEPMEHVMKGDKKQFVCPNCEDEPVKTKKFKN